MIIMNEAHTSSNMEVLEPPLLIFTIMEARASYYYYYHQGGLRLFLLLLFSWRRQPLRPPSYRGAERVKLNKLVK
jgi:hypothetical protein